MKAQVQLTPQAKALLQEIDRSSFGVFVRDGMRDHRIAVLSKLGLIDCIAASLGSFGGDDDGFTSWKINPAGAKLVKEIEMGLYRD